LALRPNPQTLDPAARAGAGHHMQLNWDAGQKYPLPPPRWRKSGKAGWSRSQNDRIEMPSRKRRSELLPIVLKRLGCPSSPYQVSCETSREGGTRGNGGSLVLSFFLIGKWIPGRDRCC
jgi:hypothetical protein